MTHQRTFVASALLCAAVWLPGVSTAQGLDAIVTPSALEPGFVQGGWFQIGLSVVPPPTRCATGRQCFWLPRRA